MTSSDLARSHTRRLSRLLSPDGRTVGVWTREGEGYVRCPKQRDSWHFWADTEGFRLAEGRRRVVVLGDSVARGYLYDPGTTYAGLLGECLRQVPGLADVDVLDLARTGATLAEENRVLHQMVQLEPHGLVVFAGNNWHYEVRLRPEQLRLQADALRSGGYAACQRLFHAFLAERAGEFLDNVAAVGQACGAPVALVVPEFNLADWAEEPFLICPVLAGAANLRWMRLREQAREALAASRFAEGARLAREMIELDGACSPVSWYLLAAALAAADPGAAESARRAAKDAAVGTFAKQSPRIITPVQEEMRRKAAEHGFALVDLPDELHRAGRGRAPGRKFFLDNCHLSFDGLAIAATATAAALGSRLGGGATRAQWLRSSLTTPPAAKLAIAHFLAATRNAHYGQVSAIVRHHLERALELDQGVAEYIGNYLDYQTRAAPNWMCASFERSALVPELARFMEIANPRACVKLADYRLRQAAVNLLACRGLGSAGAYLDLLIAEHDAAEVDLLGDAYCATTLRDRFGCAPGHPRAYRTAPDLWSDAYLVAADPADTELSVTWRLPAGDPAEAAVSVFVNGEIAGTAIVGDSWKTALMMVPARYWRTGLNTIRIGWPLRELPGDDLLSAGAESLERGAVPDSVPCYGQLFAFTATRSSVPDSGYRGGCRMKDPAGNW